MGKDISFRGKVVYRGWKLDLKKFRIYLQERYKVKKAYLFLGYIPDNTSMYDMFRSFGYDLVFKPVVSYETNKVKGNVDAELVLQAAAIDIENYDQAVIVTGDGDFGCLITYLKQKGKFRQLLVPNQFLYSSILKNVCGNQIGFVDELKNKLELPKQGKSNKKRPLPKEQSSNNQMKGTK